MKGFILTYADGRKRGYTTLAALCEDNTREELGVSESTLQKYPLSDMNYENEKIKIEVLEFKTRGDILREREILL